MIQSAIILLVTLLSLATVVPAAPIDAWGAAQCESLAVGPTPTPPCSSQWEPVTGAVGEATLDLDGGTLSVNGYLVLASGHSAVVATDATLVDAAPGFSGTARVLIDGELHEIQLQRTASGWLKIGSADLGYYIRAPWVEQP